RAKPRWHEPRVVQGSKVHETEVRRRIGCDKGLSGNRSTALDEELFVLIGLIDRFSIRISKERLERGLDPFDDRRDLSNGREHLGLHVLTCLLEPRDGALHGEVDAFESALRCRARGSNHGMGFARTRRDEILYLVR